MTKADLHTKLQGDLESNLKHVLLSKTMFIKLNDDNWMMHIQNCINFEKSNQGFENCRAPSLAEMKGHFASLKSGTRAEKRRIKAEQKKELFKKTKKKKEVVDKFEMIY